MGDGPALSRHARRVATLRGLLAAVLVAALAGCVATARERPARGAPPPPALAETRPPPPSPDSVWVPGAWRWNGVDYEWAAGRWESPRPVPGR